MTATLATNARTKAEREEMLARVETAVLAEVRRAKVPEQHVDDVAQDCRLAVWTATAQFDATRGTRWSTYGIGAIKNAVANWKVRHHHEEVGAVVTAEPEFFDRMSWPQVIEPLSSNSDEDELLGDETMGGLATEVRRTLAEGVLSQLGAGHRRLVEMVVYGGLSPDQVATQLGHPVKAVRCNLKAALRVLCRNGATSHAVTDQEVADVTTSQNSTEERERVREANRNRNRIAADAQVMGRLDAIAGDEGFQLALDRLDPDTRVAVVAIVERTFTVDEAAELLGVPRKAVVTRLRNVAGIGRRGARAAVANRRELVAR